LRVWTRKICSGLHVGHVDDESAVEPARAQQRRVEDVRPVGAASKSHRRSLEPSISTSS